MGIATKAGVMGGLLKARLTGKSIPVVLHINVTNSCNLKCSYCYGSYFVKKAEDLTTKQLISLIDEAAGMGTKVINLGAGEPLLREDIEVLVDRVRGHNIICRMNTNGHLVREKISAVRKLNSVCISIDGDEKTHDRFKGEGSFKTVVDAIQCAKENGVPVHTSTCLTKYNVHAVDFIVELAKEMGFMVEFLLPFFQMPKAFIASEADYKEALGKISHYKDFGYPIFFSKKTHQYSLSWPDYSLRSIWNDPVPKGFKYIPCWAGKIMCIVDSDGKVYPCSQMIGGYPALNFVEHGFKPAWENVRNHGCKACYAFICFKEYNLLMNLDLGVIWNQIRNNMKEAFWL